MNDTIVLDGDASLFIREDGEFGECIAVSDGSGFSQDADVIFYDYDGTIVKTYTAEEFASLTVLPRNPRHEGLIAEGWNWTLEDAQAYVAKYGMLDIGQTYITDDGATRFYITIPEGTVTSGRTFSIRFHSSSKDVDIDWGDGTTETVASSSSNTTFEHLYDECGDYIIKLYPSNTINFTGNSSLSIVGNTNTYNYNLPKLHKIELGENVIIGGYDFYNCYALETITVPLEITIMALSYAFSNCISLKSIVLPNSSQSLYVSSGAFNTCESLVNICIPKYSINFTSNTFAACQLLSRIAIPETITSISNSVFSSCRFLTRIALPDTILSLGTSAFNGCYHLKSIEIPNVTDLPNGTFYSCYELKSVKVRATDQEPPYEGFVFPDYSVGQSAFSSCRSLVNIDLPDDTPEIGSLSFYNCISMTSFTFPRLLSSIGTQAFYNCTGLKELHFKPTTPPTISGSGMNNPFRNLSTSCIIYVPEGCLEAYTTATNYPDPNTYTYMEE